MRTQPAPTAEGLSPAERMLRDVIDASAHLKRMERGGGGAGHGAVLDLVGRPSAGVRGARETLAAMGLIAGKTVRSPDRVLRRTSDRVDDLGDLMTAPIGEGVSPGNLLRTFGGRPISLALAEDIAESEGVPLLAWGYKWGPDGSALDGWLLLATGDLSDSDEGFRCMLLRDSAREVGWCSFGGWSAVAVATCIPFWDVGDDPAQRTDGTLYIDLQSVVGGIGSDTRSAPRRCTTDLNVSATIDIRSGSDLGSGESPVLRYVSFVASAIVESTDGVRIEATWPDSIGCARTGCDATDDEVCATMAAWFGLKSGSSLGWTWDLMDSSGMLPDRDPGAAHSADDASLVWQLLSSLVGVAAEAAYCGTTVDVDPGDPYESTPPEAE